jgi:predicted nucleic acid-binding protein
MIVADTSYLVEGLLRDASLLQEDTLSPELALYEVANTVWKHEFILRDLKNS